MIDISFWNILWTAVNLLIFYLFAKKFLFGRILKVMEERKKRINGQFEEADKKEQDALKLKKQYEDILEGANEESNQIISKAKKNADMQYNRILADASEQADRMIENAHKSVENERRRVLQSTQSEIADIAMTAAKKVIAGNTSAENDSRIYNDFINEVDDDGSDPDGN